MSRYICIHSHFYQPPRENPWLEEVEIQESAYPYHDWNERITDECYAPNTASRVLDGNGNIVDIVSNYSKMSFNFGPTLLSWMERHEPEIYRSILKADDVSRKNFSGHGSAIAQCYSHMIMPLANERDKQTQVIWGIRDFEHRFKRKPEGIWLPETAVDEQTLEVLAQHDIQYTILAPRQAHCVREIGSKVWDDVSDGKIDVRMPYLCKLPSGKTMNLFFYDGPISQDIAFGGLLRSGETFAKRLLAAFPMDDDQPRLSHIATDGETYGHHHHHGDMALAYCFRHIEKEKLAQITIYGEFLEKRPPTHEVKIYDNSSWSCVHGVERWRSDCGCCSGMNQKWHQKWRKPLREALDFLRDKAADAFEREMAFFTDDPWGARNRYIDVILDRSDESLERFFQENTSQKLDAELTTKFLRLLEMQRHAMLMYTSCGWFFDEISGIETTQIIQYAARVIQLLKQVAGQDLEQEFMDRLKAAPSNVREYGNGAAVYEKCAKPAMTDLLRVGVHFAISRLFENHQQDSRVYCYALRNVVCEKYESGKQKVVIGKANISSNITKKEDVINFAALHLGDHNVSAGVGFHTDESGFEEKQKDIIDAFQKNDTPKTIKLIEKSFDMGSFSLWHLFKDEQSKILYQILDSTLEEVEASLRKINAYHSPIIQVIKQLHIPLPKVLANTVVVMLNTDLLQTIGRDPIDFARLEKLVNEAKEWSLEIDHSTLGFIVTRKINHLMEDLIRNPDSAVSLERAEPILRILHPLRLNLDLWRAQNIFLSIGKALYSQMKAKADAGHQKAKTWVNAFDRLGKYLKVNAG